MSDIADSRDAYASKNRLPRLVSVKVEKKVSETSLSRGRKKLSEISLSRVEKRFPRPVSEELKKGF